VRSTPRAVAGVYSSWGILSHSSQKFFDWSSVRSGQAGWKKKKKKKKKKKEIDMID
jgi:uncharacterized protein (DUF2249 family)